MPMYFAGASVVEVFPVVPIVGNIALGAGAFSYAGQFDVTIVISFRTWKSSVRGLRDSLDQVTERNQVSA